MAGLESLKRAQERLLVKVQPSCSKEPPAVLRCQCQGTIKKNSSSNRARRSLEDKLCVLWRAELEVTQASRPRRLDIELFTLLESGFALVRL